MFTGIVEDVGRVEELKPKTKEVLFAIGAKNIDVKEIKIGESISVNGACLTVISVKKNIFTVEASHETLRRTTLSKLKVGSKVNLERSLRLGDRLGGHIVNGGRFSVNIIPYTQEATIFSNLKPGDSVNIEFDIIGKYVEKFVMGKGGKKDFSELLEKF